MRYKVYLKSLMKQLKKLSKIKIRFYPRIFTEEEAKQLSIRELDKELEKFRKLRKEFERRQK